MNRIPSKTVANSELCNVEYIPGLVVAAMRSEETSQQSSAFLSCSMFCGKEIHHPHTRALSPVASINSRKALRTTLYF